MPPSAVPSIDLRDFHALAPEIVLAVWGLIVLMADQTLFRDRTSIRRQQAVGRLTMLGLILALGAAFVPLIIRFNLYDLAKTINFAGVDYTTQPDRSLFLGALSDDMMTQVINVALIVLVGLVSWLSLSWSFTEDWGEYFALLLWSTVGMMILAASDELLTLFLSLELMTICLYLLTSFEKTRRRSPEAGLKYFVYGSVSSALFLFGLSLVYGLAGSTRLDAIRYVLRPVVSDANGLGGNVAGMTAVLLMLVGFGFKIAAVPFHQWAPDAYEGAPAPVTAWIATGSKIASFIAMMKVFLVGLGSWSNGYLQILSPGWIGVIVVLSAVTMTYGNLAALSQRNLKRMLAYSSIAHAGYMLVGVAAAAISVRLQQSAGAVLFYLIVYSFSNVGAFAIAAWLVRDKGTDEIDDLNGMAYRYPFLATCILLLMLSLIGMPPLAGFIGKLYMFMEALDQDTYQITRVALMWLVGLGLLNSVFSAFYYVRVMKAMFLRDPGRGVLAPASSSIAFPIVLGTAVVIGAGLFPAPLMELMRVAAIPMVSTQAYVSVPKRDSGDAPNNVQEPAPAPTPPEPTAAPKS